ncbi:hypothetical protein BJY04DRAFT_198720 [Aspergillus karnatakaensis]|uniref:pentatricopeptide repeat protein n=1 Tax=Aspergillus karnatakaensis TaxID=1810916 RepID=UPI003CCD7768
MSFCAHRLLLARLRAGSPSRPPQQRLCTKLRYQQRDPLGARLLSENALHRSIALSTETVDAIRASARLHDSSSVDTSGIPVTPDSHGANQPTEILDEEDDSDTPNSVANRKPAVTLIRSPYGSDKNVTHEQVGTIVYHHYGPGGKQVTSVRKVSQEMWRKEMNHRSKSLFETLPEIRRWKDACAAIAEARSRGNTSRTPPIELPHNKEDEALIEKLATDPDNAFKEAWTQLGKTERIGHWNRLSLWLLYHSPERVPDLLRITCQRRLKPVFSCVSACILHLQRFYPHLVDKSLITTCLHPGAWPILIIPQKGIRVYLRAADRSGVYAAWHRTRKHRLHMTPQSILCFMNRFIEFEDADSALEAIQIVRNMKHPTFHMRSESVIRHCCKLLVLDCVVGVGNDRNFRILPKLLELGVQPTRELMNVVLANAYSSGDMFVGQSILDYMKQRNMEYDSFTYITLLTHAVRTGDRNRFASLLQEVQLRAELRRNPWISSKILHAHFVFTTQRVNQYHDPDAVFYSILDVYSRLYDISPLKELQILPHNYTPPDGSVDFPPSVVALYIMIASYLRCMKSFSLAESVFRRFKRCVIEGHEVIAPLAATDHAYNEFLVAFRKYPEGLRTSVHLVEHMLHAASSDSSSSESKDSGFKHATPTIRTWTLLMSGFVFNDQPLAAEKVKAMMNKHGVEYEPWTWNIIINNYANSQNVPALAQSIKDMERRGVTPNKYTLNSLRFLRDPERLWVAISELDNSPDSSPAAGEKDADKHKDTVSLLEQGLRRLKDTMAARS